MESNYILTNNIPQSLIIYGGDKKVVEITDKGEVIVKGDVYEAAKAFWDAVIQMAPRFFKGV